MKDFNMKKIICILVIILVAFQVNAQVQFIQSGRIELEKRVNQHAHILAEG